jgi:fibronectin type 3 domain-containing protein
MPRVRIALVFLAAVVGAASAGSVAGGTDTTTTTQTTTTVDQPTAPGPPTLTSATAGSGGIGLIWTAPASDGGSALTGFRVYRATGNGPVTLLADLGLVDSYTDAGVTAGTTYRYQVSAVNAVGEGPFSYPLSATATGSSPGSLFDAYQAIPVGSWPEAVAIGDVSGDGRNDVVMTTSYYFDPGADYRLWVFVQAPDGTLSAPVSYATTATYGSRPDSVAIGDITGDGRVDVVVGIDGVGVQVFPQLVSGVLGSPASFATPDSNKIRLGQLDGDGRLDVAGVGWGTNTVGVLLNDGHGGLSPRVSYPVQHSGYDDLEIADVTGDGLDDLVVMSGQTYAVPNVSVLAQLAAGGFGAAAEYRVAPNTNSHGIGVGDVNGDGRNDVVASYGGNSPGSAIAVFAQTASGTLAAPAATSSYDIPQPVEVADVDLDGRADVVVLHGGWLKAGVYRQQSNGTLGPEELYAIPYASQYNPHGLAVGDINSDGFPDLVLADYNNGLVVLRRTTPPTTVPAAPNLTAAAPSNGGASLTWDGSSGSPSGYRIFRGTTSGGETLLATVGNVTAYTDTAAGKGQTYYYQVSAFNSLGESARSNERSVTTWTAPGAPTLMSATAGSGGINLVWTPPASDGGSAITGFRVYRAAGTGSATLLASVGQVASFTDSTTSAGTTYSYQVSAVSPVGEGPLSNALSATGPGSPGSLFAPYQAIPVGSWPEAVAIGDANADGRNDVVMTTSYYFDPGADYRLWVFLQAPDGTLSPPVSYATVATYGSRPDSVAIGDITGDGRADVVVGIDGVGVQVFPQLSSGGLGSPASFATPDSNKIRLGQLDGDGRLDVAGVGWGTNTVGVLLNDGHGGLSPRVSYPVQHDGYDDLEIADVTGDGRDDLIVMSGQGFVPNVSVLAQLTSGGFGAAAEYSVASNVLTHGVGVGDVNGDGRNDVVASYGGNRPASAIAVLAQTASGTLAAPAGSSSYDIPEPVEVADVDLDGRADVVLLHGGWLKAGVYRQQSNGTLGPEELYAIPYASHYNPHGLTVGDVNGDGSPDIVLADYNNGLVVLRNTTAPTTAPAAPNLTGAAAANGSVSLSWAPPSSNGGSPSGYRIYRGTTSGGETLLATLGTATAYTDATAAAGKTYYYQVSAVNSLGEGARSNERSATSWTVPGAPNLITAKAGNSGVALGWNAPAFNGGAAINAYKIYRGTSSGGETLLVTTGNVTSYTDTTAANGKTSYYQVSAVNAVGEGSRSNELAAKRGH